MGTNYYIDVDGEELHIGKSSSGWVFSLRVYPERNINTIFDWLVLINNNEIRDEYYSKISVHDMINIIMNRSRPEPPGLNEHDMEINHAEIGPNNLLRGKEENGRTHGEGTWDYCNYDFF